MPGMTSVSVLAADPGGELGSRGEPELAEDVLDVRIDRSLGQDQLFGDLPVPEALGHQLGDLPLPPGQRVGGDLARRDRSLVPGHRYRLGYGQLQAALTVALEPLVAQR